MKTSVQKRLFSRDRRAVTLLALAVAAGFFAAVLLAVQLWLFSRTVDRVFLQHSSLQDVYGLLGGMLALLAARSGLLWLRDVLAQFSASRVKSSLRQHISARLFTLGPAYTRRQSSGELVSLAGEGVETLDEYLTQYLPAVALAAGVPVFIFLVVLALDPWSSLVLLVAGPFLLLLLGLIGGQTRAITERRFLELGWMSAFFLDILQGIATLKMFGRSREQAVNIEEISRRFGDTTMDILRTAFQTSLVMEWSATAATALVALEISLRLMNHSLAFERGLAVLLLTPEFFLPLRQMALRYHSGTAGKAAAERVFALLDTPLLAGPTKHGPRIIPLTVVETLLGHPSPAGLGSQVSGDKAVGGEIHFEQVNFTYPGMGSSPGEQRPALHEFSLTIPSGRSLALVGPSGAGKSTVASLLLRFIEPDAGLITFGGQSLEEIERSEWLRQVAWVPQLPHLFQGTVADNLRLALPGAGQELIEQAAQAANAGDFIRRLPQGYQTPLGEGGQRLSGGQRQRLAIARAFLKDAPILILDEPTTHLDRETERLVWEALARLATGRTTLIIAHSLRLAAAADQIAVMAKGQVVERGDHNSLIGQGGLYARMAARTNWGAAW